jgi:hypothetical protein
MEFEIVRKKDQSPIQNNVGNAKDKWAFLSEYGVLERESKSNRRKA